MLQQPIQLKPNPEKPSLDLKHTDRFESTINIAYITNTPISLGNTPRY